MIKALLPLVVLVVSSPAFAAGVGPEIAYVKAGTISEIYLVEPDGSRLTRLYRSGQRLRIFSLDMKPGGGQLAFEETSNSATSSATLKVISYDDSGRITSTTSLPTCRIGSIDYHPGGQELLYTDLCGHRAMRLDIGSMTSADAGLAHGTIKANWRGSSEIVYSALGQIWTAQTANPAGATPVAAVDFIQGMDLSTSGELDIVDHGDDGTLHMVNLTSGAVQPRWQIGHYGHFSPDDQRVVYATGYDVRGQYLMIRRTDGSGNSFRLAGKAAFGPVDWRN